MRHNWEVYTEREGELDMEKRREKEGEVESDDSPRWFHRRVSMVVDHLLRYLPAGNQLSLSKQIIGTVTVHIVYCTVYTVQYTL